ncbi:MAG: type IV conjugative transfer system lipoprotein TraV [Thiotrichales bacterium]|jgi:conjugal transfer pilus assembly protein TraV|nr:type IV conjugative transfer system lipoprotein TraV [Thiotrichales bacterium]
MQRFMVLLLPIVLLTLSGCSITGLGGKSEFSCGAPEGTSCRSLNEVYDIASSGDDAKAKRKDEKTDGHGSTDQGADNKSDKTDESAAPKSRFIHEAISSGAPIRSEPVIMRIAMFPWQDTDGVLHDISYQYVTLNTGNWLIEHNQSNLRSSVFSPLVPKQAPVVGEK